MADCSYNCSHHPTEIDPDNDITGIGVTISYVANAGIVVAIIMIHYLVAYDPELDPFRTGGNTEPKSPDIRGPNPIDKILLGGLRKAWKILVRMGNINIPTHPRLEESLIKCVLVMSDVQIVTGISILVSGLGRLRCGISCYHWQVMVYLAWFSSLTHLSCLSLLRDYLYDRPVERVWRLCSMFLLVVLLIICLMPTANNYWSSGQKWEGNNGSPTIGDYAICSFKPTNIDTTGAFGSMIFSVLLLGIGFITRVIKIHKSLSTIVHEKLRKKLSHFLRYCLFNIFRTVSDRSTHSLLRLLFYRPLLAVFLVLRILADIWSSMFLEIWWLIASFVWGIIRLRETRNLYPIGNSDWTFGQIASVVLLAIPLVTVVEHLYPSNGTHHQDRAENTTESSRPGLSTMLLSNISGIQLPDPSSLSDIQPERTGFSASKRTESAPDDPNCQFLYDSGFLTTPALSAVFSIILITLAILALGATGYVDSAELFDGDSAFLEPLGMALFHLIVCILLCFLISSLDFKTSSEQRIRLWIASGLRGLLLAISVSGFLWVLPSSVFNFWGIYLVILPGTVCVVYVVASVLMSIFH